MRPIGQRRRPDNLGVMAYYRPRISFSGFRAMLLLFSFLFSCQEEEQSLVLPPLDPAELEWVAIPGGIMRTSGGVPWLAGVKDFELMALEVTQEQYGRWYGGLPEGNDDCPSCPVLNVAPDDAIAFCQAVGGRLPTENEWVYASFGGGSYLPVCFDDEKCLLKMEWCPQNSCLMPHPVGLKLPNPYGLYDMVGNAAEWVYECDNWNDYYYEQELGSTIYAKCPADKPPLSTELSFLRCDGAKGFPSFFEPFPDTMRITGVRCAR